MNKNAELFQKMLEDEKINAFAPVREEQDDFHSNIFRTSLDVNGKLLQTLVIFDDTPYIVIRCFVEPKAVNDNNRVAVERELTKLNGENKVLKYYITPAEDIAVATCVPVIGESFEPNVIRLVLDVFMHALPEAYAPIMKSIYGDVAPTEQAAQ